MRSAAEEAAPRAVAARLGGEKEVPLLDLRLPRRLRNGREVSAYRF